VRDANRLPLAAKHPEAIKDALIVFDDYLLADTLTFQVLEGVRKVLSVLAFAYPSDTESDGC
jgi:hypothetical protein